MKRIYIFLLGLIIFTSGCSFNVLKKETPATTPIENATITVQGEIVENQGKTLLSSHKYILQNENGRTLYLLESVTDDLSKYVGAGMVSIVGEKKAAGENEVLATLKVYTVDLLAPPKSASEKLFTSSALGFSVVFPQEWTAKEENNQAHFFGSASESSPLATADLITSTSAEGKTFASTKNTLTAISVGAKPAFRITTTDRTTLFVPLENSILRFQFFGTEEEKADFYQLIASLEFLTSSVTGQDTAQTCGGQSGFSCPAGYRCELSGTAKDTSGTCVPAINRPTVPPKEEISHEDDPAPAISPSTEAPIIISDSSSSADADKTKVLSYLRTQLNQLVSETPPSGSTWTILRFSFSLNNLVAVEFQASADAAVKRKILFAYTVQGNQVTVTQKATFVPGETTDWQLQEGENLQSSQPTEIYAGTGEKKTNLEAGYSLYESASYHFRIEYPKKYYYANVAKTGDRIAVVNFAETPVTADNAVITVQILDGAAVKSLQSALEIVLPRDDHSHFLLTATGPEYAEILSHMAASLSSGL